MIEDEKGIEIEHKEDEVKEIQNNSSYDKVYMEQNNFLLMGKKGSGKTALAWAFAKKINDISKRKICVYNHPRPQLLEGLPFKVDNITQIEQMFILTDCVVIIDESHEVFNCIDKKVNNQLKTILSKSRQNNTCFIFVCHNSYFVNRSLFSFMDVKILKEVNKGQFELERKHIKRLYEEVVVFGKENFYIDSDYVRGYQSFNKPDWYSESLSLSYRSNISRRDFFK